MSTMDNLLGGLTGNDSQKQWAPKVGVIEVRWTRDAVSDADVPRSLLGVMGRRSHRRSDSPE